MKEDDFVKQENEFIKSEVLDPILAEKRHARRWKMVRFAGWMFILLLYAILIFSPSKATDSFSIDKPYVSLMRLNGPIMAGTNFSAQKVVPQLIKAFKDKESRGVVLVINSPGGSPVQSTIIHDKILQLKKEYKKEVVVVGQDALASGAYLVATAADKIYVSPDTLTGSIGVVMAGFGFSDAIQKIGVSRRVFTSGRYKDRLDPFKPLNQADQQKVEAVLNNVHQHFIQDVKNGRGNRLKGNPSELYSGDFWTGEQAVKLGLADGTDNLWTVLQDQFKVKHYRNYSVKHSWFADVIKNMESRLNIGLNYEGSPIMAIYHN